MHKVLTKFKRKRGLKVFLVIAGIFIVFEIIALIWLATSVSRYANFWSEKAKESGEITYLALGDSAAQGIGASSPMKGYVGLIAKEIEKQSGKSVRVVNLSKTGATLKDYLEEQALLVKEYKADLVTIEIGANDVKNFDRTKFREDFKKVLETLPDGSFVANMPLFNSRPSSTPKAKEASKIIEEELRNYPKLNFVDLQTVTQQNQSIFGFAPDLFHPNNLSYKNWSNAFMVKIGDSFTNNGNL
jgi:acyl-CoA thioesterase-1